MDWALGEGQRNTQVRSMLRDRLEKFEPRLALMSEISLQEDTTENSVTFYIAGAVRSQSGTDRVEIIKTLSRMDQYPQKAG
jgi:predicted component of type VI protein secretion system